MSTIPVRRQLRATRPVSKDNENANARLPTRTTTRIKPPSKGPTAAAAAATAPTVASRAKAVTVAAAKADPAAQGKRKREALVEVTALVTNNKTKNPGTAAGPAKAKVQLVKDKPSSVAVKGRVTTVVAEPRQPLRTVVGPTIRRATRPAVAEPVRKPASKTKGKPPVQVHHDASTAVEPGSTARPALARRSVVKMTTQGLVERRAEVEHPEPEPVTEQQAEEPRYEDHVCKKPRMSDPPERQADAKVVSPKEVIQDECDRALEAYADEEEVEADPEGDQWYDLDLEDADDPLMASEYVIDIVKYMRELEITTLPNPNYMASQTELAWNMRGILTDWLVTIHVRFRLLPETLFLCVNVIDRFLSARVVSLSKLQLVGITCMFIASKTEETYAPSVKAYLLCADSTYTETDILQAERYILKTLDWNLSYPNPVHFLRRVSKADDYDITVRTVAKFLLEIQCMEWRLLAAPASLMAAASIWLARLVLAREHWTPNLAHYSGYAESSIVPVANLILNYILKPVEHNSFFKKYAGKRYFKSSVYLRQWALRRWPEGTLVDLKAQLPMLKAEIRELRQRAAAAEGEKKAEIVDQASAPTNR